MCHTWSSQATKGALSPSCKIPAGLPAWVQAPLGSSSPGGSRVLPLLHMWAPTWPVCCHGAAVRSSALVPRRFTSCMLDAQSTEICSLQGRDVSQPWKDPPQVTAPMGTGEAEAKHFHSPQGLSDPCYTSMAINSSSVSACVRWLLKQKKHVWSLLQISYTVEKKKKL